MFKYLIKNLQKIILSVFLIFNNTGVLGTQFFNECLKSELRTELGKHLARVVTSKYEEYAILDKPEINMHMYSRWIKNIHSKENQPSSLNGGKSSNLILSSKCEHTSFHDKLGKRIKNLLRKNLLTISNDEMFISKKSLNNMNYYGEKNFSYGHAKTIDGITSYHKLFISLYDQNEVDFNKSIFEKKKIQWLCPIEQVLMCRTLKDYRQNVAILKSWGAYSNIALVFIPAGTHIRLRMGLVNPQTYPSILEDKLEFNKQDLKEAEESRSNLNISQYDIHNKLYEHAKGGATQFQIISAESVSEPDAPYIIRLPDAIIYNSINQPKWGKKKLENKNGTKWLSSIWGSLENGESSHFIEDFYDSAQLNVPKSLRNLKIIDDHELKEIESILKFCLN